MTIVANPQVHRNVIKNANDWNWIRKPITTF